MNKTIKPKESIARYSAEQVRQVRGLSSGGMKGPKVAEITGVSVHVVRQINQRRSYRWVH